HYTFRRSHLKGKRLAKHNSLNCGIHKFFPEKIRIYILRMCPSLLKKNRSYCCLCLLLTALLISCSEKKKSFPAMPLLTTCRCWLARALLIAWILPFLPAADL